MAFNSNNPFLSNKRFSSNAVSKAEEVHQAQIIDYNQEMSVSGTINKTAILFLIFDLEIVFLFPWSVILLQLPLFSFWIIFYFFFSKN